MCNIYCQFMDDKYTMTLSAHNTYINAYIDKKRGKTNTVQLYKTTSALSQCWKKVYYILLDMFKFGEKLKKKQ